MPSIACLPTFLLLLIEHNTRILVAVRQLLSSVGLMPGSTPWITGGRAGCCNWRSCSRRCVHHVKCSLCASAGPTGTCGTTCSSLSRAWCISTFPLFLWSPMPWSTLTSEKPYARQPLYPKVRLKTIMYIWSTCQNTATIWHHMGNKWAWGIPKTIFF